MPIESSSPISIVGADSGPIGPYNEPVGPSRGTLDQEQRLIERQNARFKSRAWRAGAKKRLSLPYQNYPPRDAGMLRSEVSAAGTQLVLNLPKQFRNINQSFQAKGMVSNGRFNGEVFAKLTKKVSLAYYSSIFNPYAAARGFSAGISNVNVPGLGRQHPINMTPELFKSGSTTVTPKRSADPEELATLLAATPDRRFLVVYESVTDWTGTLTLEAFSDWLKLRPDVSMSESRRLKRFISDQALRNLGTCNFRLPSAEQPQIAVPEDLLPGDTYDFLSTDNRYQALIPNFGCGLSLGSQRATQYMTHVKVTRGADAPCGTKSEFTVVFAPYWLTAKHGHASCAVGLCGSSGHYVVDAVEVTSTFTLTRRDNEFVKTSRYEVLRRSLVGDFSLITPDYPAGLPQEDDSADSAPESRYMHSKDNLVSFEWFLGCIPVVGWFEGLRPFFPVLLGRQYGHTERFDRTTDGSAGIEKEMPIIVWTRIAETLAHHRNIQVEIRHKPVEASNPERASKQMVFKATYTTQHLSLKDMEETFYHPLANTWRLKKNLRVLKSTQNQEYLLAAEYAISDQQIAALSQNIPDPAQVVYWAKMAGIRPEAAGWFFSTMATCSADDEENQRYRRDLVLLFIAATQHHGVFFLQVFFPDAYNRRFWSSETAAIDDLQRRTVTFFARQGQRRDNLSPQAYLYGRIAQAHQLLQCETEIKSALLCQASVVLGVAHGSNRDPAFLKRCAKDRARLGRIKEDIETTLRQDLEAFYNPEDPSACVPSGPHGWLVERGLHRSQQAWLEDLTGQRTLATRIKEMAGRHPAHWRPLADAAHGAPDTAAACQALVDCYEALRQQYDELLGIRQMLADGGLQPREGATDDLLRQVDELLHRTARLQHAALHDRHVSKHMVEALFALHGLWMLFTSVFWEYLWNAWVVRPGPEVPDLPPRSYRSLNSWQVVRAA